MEIKQYDIVLVNLDTTVGSEIRKTRPCLIISPNEINYNLRTTTVAPLTTSNKKYPTRVKINFQKKTGFVVIDQIRTIDQSRVIKVLGKINRKEIKECKAVIRETFVD
jgi:mRNA interferase MazF